MAAGLVPAVLLLAGCEVPKEVNPVEIYREVSGENDAQRQRPPRSDQPYGNLGQVPPRPDRPSIAVREATTAALAADRERARDALAPRSGPLPRFAPSPGSPPVAAAPPPPARLGGVPAIPWTTPGQGVAPVGNQTMPADPGQRLPEAPPPDLLGPRRAEPGLPPPAPEIGTPPPLPSIR